MEDKQMPAETPYTVAVIAALTGFSVQTVIRLFENERGVLMLETHTSGKRAYRSMRVPRPVYRRVMAKYTIQ